jgi:hypothetical protein
MIVVGWKLLTGGAMWSILTKVLDIGTMNTKQRMFDMELFSFYLDAWNFCRHNNIEIEKITRQDWATWVVNIE